MHFRRLTPAHRKTLLKNARDLRREMTTAEKKLWLHLRGDQMDGLRFRRQHRIGQYIVDFYCGACALVIELDGTSHLLTEQADQAREAELEARGLHILHLANADVLNYTEAVVNASVMLAPVAFQMHPLPTPLPEYRERE
jgi:very-short-patch-repair endonuclease